MQPCQRWTAKCRFSDLHFHIDCFHHVKWLDSTGGQDCLWTRQATEHTPILHKGWSRSLLLLFHGLEWDINLTKLQQTANLWENHLRLQLWFSVFLTPFSSTPSAQIKNTSDTWNSFGFFLCCALLDAVTRRQHFPPSYLLPKKIIKLILHPQKPLTLFLVLQGSFFLNWSWKEKLTFLQIDGFKGYLSLWETSILMLLKECFYIKNKCAFHGKRRSWYEGQFCNAKTLKIWLQKTIYICTKTSPLIWPFLNNVSVWYWSLDSTHSPAKDVRSVTKCLALTLKKIHNHTVYIKKKNENTNT